MNEDRQIMPPVDTELEYMKGYSNGYHDGSECVEQHRCGEKLSLPQITLLRRLVKSAERYILKGNLHCPGYALHQRGLVEVERWTSIKFAYFEHKNEGEVITTCTITKKGRDAIRRVAK